MKFIIAMQNKLNAMRQAAFNCVKKQEGQNTVEYVIMLVVVVGVAMLVGSLVNKMMPEVFEKVKASIMGRIDE